MGARAQQLDRRPLLRAQRNPHHDVGARNHRLHRLEVWPHRVGVSHSRHWLQRRLLRPHCAWLSRGTAQRLPKAPLSVRAAAKWTRHCLVGDRFDFIDDSNSFGRWECSPRSPSFLVFCSASPSSRSCSRPWHPKATEESYGAEAPERNGGPPPSQGRFHGWQVCGEGTKIEMMKIQDNIIQIKIKILLLF